MIKEAYECGVESAFEKLGFIGGSVVQSAGSSVAKNFGTKFTKSVSNSKNLVPRITNNKVGPTGRAGPATTSPGSLPKLG